MDGGKSKQYFDFLKICLSSKPVYAHSQSNSTKIHLNQHITNAMRTQVLKNANYITISGKGLGWDLHQSNKFNKNYPQFQPCKHSHKNQMTVVM